MMNEAAKADSDSLMALQALLKFRSDSIAENEETLPQAGKMNMASCVSATANPTENSCKRPAPPMKQQHHVPFPGPTLSHVTPPFGALSPRSALSPTFSLNYNVVQNKSAHLPSAPYSPQVDPVTVPSAAVSLQGVVPSGGVDTQVNQQGKKANETAAAKPAVRTTEIEAALRSKPQRGRKRDNLSALERLELTRTRNREHAKSTR